MKKRDNDKSTKKGLPSLGEIHKLTPTETEVLDMRTREFLTQRQISIRRGCSKQAVSKIMKKLKEKGAITLSLEKVDQDQSTCQPWLAKTGIRCHAQEFNVAILYKDERYEKILKRGNMTITDGNTVRLYKNSIEVYGKKSFFGEDAQRATAQSFKYWHHFFAILENDLGVILIKRRKFNFRLVRSEYAQINNGLARECGDKAQHVSVYGTDDGKLWFKIDNSFNLNEAETVHPERAKQDMDGVIGPFFNDLRDNPGLRLSEIRSQLVEISRNLYALAANSEPKVQSDNGQSSIKKPEYIG